MIHEVRPKDFKPQFTCVACILEHEGEIVLLLRQDHKKQPNTWGLPAGKVEQDESLEDAMEREIFQETGLVLHEKPKHFVTLDVSYPSADFVYHLYHLPLKSRPEVKISLDEHKNFKWVTPEIALSMDLIGDLRECLKLYYKI